MWIVYCLALEWTLIGRVVVRSVDYRSLGALGMPLAMSLDWRFASSLMASATPCRACAGVNIFESDFEMYGLRL